jgi:TPR repeat protein
MLGDSALPNRWAEDPDPGEPAPKSDLNPLLNPVLEQNLGRWAQVYFTNPPETRERAVMDLLRDLENPAPRNAAAAPASESADASAPGLETTVCAICRGENRGQQKFCGHCGTPLRPPQRAASFAEPEPETLSVLGLSSAPGPQEEKDLDFLREKSFEKAYYEPESGSHRGLYAAVVILLAGATYFGWPFLRAHFPSSPQTASAVRSQPAPQAPSAVSMPPESTPATEAVRPAPSAPQKSAAPEPERDQPEISGAAPVNTPPPKSAQTVPDSRPATVTLASDSQSSRGTADGTQELLLAQRYLKAGHTPTNTAAAARWLWRSVSKQNGQAALLLADLYERGDGVSKSCDQARILAGSAVKKGLPGAALKLRTIESSCR